MSDIGTNGWLVVCMSLDSNYGVTRDSLADAVSWVRADARDADAPTNWDSVNSGIAALDASYGGTVDANDGFYTHYHIAPVERA